MKRAKSDTRNQSIYMIKRLLSSVEWSIKALIFLAVGIIMASIVTMMRPQIISRLTDDGLAKGEFGIIILWCVVLLFVSLIEYGNELFQIKVFVHMSNHFTQKLYQMALEKIIKVPYHYLQLRNSAEILSTINGDINRISLLMDRNSLMLLRYCFQIIGGTIGLFLLDWRVAFAVLMVIPVKQVIVIYMSQKKTKLTDKYIQEWQNFSEWFGSQTNGLDMIVKNRTEGYHFQIKDNGVNLSGGEKQKIAFLRAIIKKANIIVVDEAFSNCDEESREIMRSILFDIKFSKTVIIVSHYKEDLEGTQSLYELKGGKIAKIR